MNALQTLIGSLRVSGPDFGPVAIEGVKRGDDRQWRLKIGDADWRRWNEVTEVSAEAYPSSRSGRGRHTPSGC